MSIWHISCMRAHPRSRGENPDRAAGPGQVVGSSPLTRGKQDDCGRGCLSVGLIPAHAGKTKALEISLRRCGAHPRSRGENDVRVVRRARIWGSSPLTRGKLAAETGRTYEEGLIPAHAGKTLRPSRASSPTRAHPRSRGENRTRGIEVPGFQGSSPLTRGKPGEGAHVPQLSGLIPAHAGKTAQGQRLRRARRGSSPLTRGKLR